MPVTFKKMPNGMVQVRTPHMIHAKATTPEKAEAQRRLLNAVEHSDWRPDKKKKRLGG